MKKILSLLLIAVLSLTLLTGCSDPVADDLENFINVEMKEVNENDEKISNGVNSFKDIELEEAIVLISDELLPLADDSLEKLEGIKPETAEVKEIKDKYVKVVETYKEGFEEFLDAVVADDGDALTASIEKINGADDYLTEYNDALEKLAEEHGMKAE